MVAPTPVSALLHAVAVVKVGVFSTVRVMLYVFGVDTMDALNLGLPTAYFVSITILVASIIALSKDNLKARLAYSTVSQLSYIILGVALLTPAGHRGRPGPHRQPRLLQDHALLLRRRHLRRHAQEEHLRDERPGARDALHVRRLCPRLAQHDRRAARGRVCQQMVSAERRLRRRIGRHHRRAAGQHAAQRRLLRPGRLSGLLRQALAGRCRASPRRGAPGDGDSARRSPPPSPSSSAFTPTSSCALSTLSC